MIMPTKYINFGLYMYMLLLYPMEQSVSRKVSPPQEKFLYPTLYNFQEFDDIKKFLP